MSNLPAVTELSRDLGTQLKSIESSLPSGMCAKRFLRTTVNAIATHAQSDKLMKASRQSLFLACQKAAGDGLLLDGNESTLVIFSGEVAYMPMVQGLVKLARNSGEIKNITAQVVYEKDGFVYRPGLDNEPQFTPDWFGERGEPVGVYAVVTTKDGEKIAAILPKSRVLSIAAGGRNGYQYSPEKGAHFEEWWKKTAIKNVLKYAPKSTYLDSAIDNDNQNYDLEQNGNHNENDREIKTVKSVDDVNAMLDAPQPEHGDDDII